MFKKHQTKVIILIFFIISIFLSAFLRQGDVYTFIVDYPFHFNRILGVAENIKQGEIFNSIDFNTMGGLGYLNPLFYNNLFLYPFALMKVVGFSHTTIISTLLFFIYFITQIVSFFSAKSYFKNTMDSLLFTFSFTLSSYHLFDIVYRGAIGELLAIAMLPIPLFAFLNILLKNKYNNYWLLSIGLLLVFINHNITTLLLIALFIILYLLNIFKNSEAKNITITFFKSGILFTTLSLFYTIPMLLASHSQEFNVGVNSIFNLSDTTKLWQYTNVVETIIHSFINNPLSANLGIVGIFSIIVGIIRFNKLSRFSKQILIISISIFSSMFLFMDTGMLNSTPINIIQFSWRFYIILVPILSILFIDILNGFKKEKIIKNLKIATLAFYVVFIGIFKVVQLDIIIPNMDVSLMSTVEYIDNNNNYTYNIGTGREYLPSVIKPQFNDYADLIEMSHDIHSQNSSTRIFDVDKKYSSISFDVVTLNKDIIEVPFIYYKDFFKVTANDKEIPFEISENGMIQLTIDSNFKGTILVEHENPWYVWFSYLCTFVFSSLVIYLFSKKHPSDES